jgi:hypothetical protein
MLAALGHGHRFVAEMDFRGVKVLLFSKSGPLPSGMHVWAGDG